MCMYHYYDIVLLILSIVIIVLHLKSTNEEGRQKRSLHRPQQIPPCHRHSAALWVSEVWLAELSGDITGMTHVSCSIQGKEVWCLSLSCSPKTPLLLLLAVSILSPELNKQRNNSGPVNQRPLSTCTSGLKRRRCRIRLYVLLVL